MQAPRPTPYALVLASRSPRRAALLRAAGYRFTVGPFPDVDETCPQGCTPREAVERIARAKAEALRPIGRDRLVLVADTLVFLDEAPLGKPADAAAARAMLRRLSGRVHAVRTGVGLLGPDGAGGERLVVASEVTQVGFRALDDAEIGTYVAGGEPLGKAGAYAVQGGGAAFVRFLRGPRDNVIGLPLGQVRSLLAAWSDLSSDGGVGR